MPFKNKRECFFHQINVENTSWMGLAYVQFAIMKWWIVVSVCLIYKGLRAQEPVLYDVVIHEIFADPTPVRSLPSSEFIELRNRSGKEINMKNWTVTNGSTTGKINSQVILKPDSLLVLCPASSLPQFLPFGPVVSVSPWPTLNNDGDTIIIFSSTGQLIHAVNWNTTWYDNTLKKDGGWSIEMKDVRFPCLGKENWSSATDSRGGTPSQSNSIQSIQSDVYAPYPRFIYMPDSITVAIVYAEPLLAEVAAATSISIDELGISSLSLLPPMFNVLVVKLKKPAVEKTLYTLNNLTATDCALNKSPPVKLSFGRFSTVKPLDVVINEILFDPVSGGFDYVEILNRSDKILDVSTLFLANRNASGSLSSIQRIRSSPFPLLAGEYLAVTEDSTWLRQHYDCGNVMMTDAMPSYPDDQGTVVLLDETGRVTDELNYNEKWHFPLIRNREGIALERLNTNAPTQNMLNWHSASTSAGYGTPGLINSQSVPNDLSTGELTLSSRVISPDLDGRDDFMLINYQFAEPGYVANITIYDAFGNPVKYLVKNALCGIKGQFRWDGTGENNNTLVKGHYIILTETFNLNGTTKKFRNAIGLIR